MEDQETYEVEKQYPVTEDPDLFLFKQANGLYPGNHLVSRGELKESYKDFISIRTFEPVHYISWSSFYTNKMTCAREVESEFDLKKVFMFYHNEPIIERAIKKRIDLMFKNGFKVVGTKDKVVNSLRKRLFEICLVGEQTVEMFMRELAENLFKYSNVFVYKKRDESNSSISRKRGGKPPIAGFQILSPMVMRPYVRADGTIEEWRQYDLNGTQLLNTYKPADIVHLAVNKETGFIFGKPIVLSVMPDVEALRRIEENVQMLIAQHLFPLYHYQVGTDDRPAQYFTDGSSEVDVVRRLVVSLPTQGVVFTPERHKITSVSNKDVVDVTKYLEYFKTRVYIGLGVSSVDLGEGGTSNRGTAVTISQNLKEAVGADQQVFCGLFTTKILFELLKEMNFGIDLMNALGDIELRLFTIDVDEKIKRETHVLSLYVGGLLTHDEARDYLSLDAITEDELLNETQIGFKFKLQTLLAAAAPKPAAPGAGNAPEAGGSSEPTVKKTMNIVRPENKQGTKLGPKRTTNEGDPEEKDSNFE